MIFKKVFNIVTIFLFSLFLILTFNAEGLEDSPAKGSQSLSDIKIRVLLIDQTPNKESNIHFFNVKASSNLKFKIGNESSVHDLGYSEVYVQCNDGEVVFLDKRLKEIQSLSFKNIKYVTLLPSSGNTLSMNGKEYDGGLSFLITKDGKTQVINTLRLDDYVHAVACCESILSWKMAMFEVQVILVRSYAVYQIIASRKKKLSYDIKNSNLHQTYKGKNGFAKLREAVNSTKDMIVAYKNKVALTMYDICCGGIVTADMRQPNFNDAPHLARRTPCCYCFGCKAYSWHIEYSEEDFLKKLKNNPNLKEEFNNFGRLMDVNVIDKDKAGVVFKVQLKGTNKTVVVEGKTLWSLMKDKVKSQFFTIKKSLTSHGAKIIINGRGDGHLVGLCQMGANKLVSQGWDFKRVLSFYYPGTKILQVNSVKM